MLMGLIKLTKAHYFHSLLSLLNPASALDHKTFTTLAVPLHGPQTKPRFMDWFDFRHGC